MTTPETMVAVHLLALPVPLAERAREHFEGLTREFFLIATSSEEEHHVPARLLSLVNTLTAQFAGVNARADQHLEDAVRAGAPTIDDHVLDLPPQAGPACQALGDLLEEADRYCTTGRHLLTLATPPDCLAYRQWYLGEVIGQLEGKAPVAWPDSAPARRLGT